MSESSQSEHMVLEDMALTELIPYWRNPRKISNEAVNAVAESIKRYGYQQPIVVDDENVIIIGHTRYAALRRLGVERVPVRVERDLTPMQIKELRAVDNRVSEYTEWDFEKLVEELTQLDGDLTRTFFSDVLPSSEDLMEPEPDDEDEETGGETGGAVDAMSHDAAEFICPSCFHSWETQISERDLRKGRIEEAQ